MNYKSLTAEMYRHLYFPTFAIQIVLSLIIVLNFVIPGQYFGEWGLAVLTLVAPLYCLCEAFVDMISVGGSNAFSIAVGSGDLPKARRFFTATVACALLFGLLFLVAGWALRDPLVRLLGADAGLFEATREVFSVLLFLFPCMVLYCALDYFARNVGELRLAVGLNLFYVIVSVLLSIYLVGYTSLGLVGSPMATVLTMFTASVVLLTVCCRKHPELHFTRQMGWTDMQGVLHMGSGLVVRKLYQGIITLVFNNLLMSFHGETGVVVYMVIVNAQTIADGIFTSISETIQPLIGVYTGENFIKGIRQTMRCAAYTGLTFCVGLITAALLIPDRWLQVLGLQDMALLALSLQSLQVYVWSLPFLCFTEVMSNYYQFVARPELTRTILTGRLCFVLAAGSLGLYLGSLQEFFFSLIIAELLAAGCCWLLARRSVRRSAVPRSCPLLLDASLKQIVLEFAAEPAALMEEVYKLDHLLKEYGAPQRACTWACLTLEEMGTEIVERNQGKKGGLIELQLTIQEAGLTMILRDNCSAYDTEKGADRAASELVMGTPMIRKAARQFEYLPTIGYNRTILSFKF